MGTLPLGTTGQLLLWQGTGLSLLKSALPKMLSAKVLSLLLPRPLCWSELDAQLSVPPHFLYPKTDVLRRPVGWLHTPHFQLFAWCWRNRSSSIWPWLALCQFCDFTWKCVILSFSWAGQPLTAPIVTFLWLFFVHYNSLQSSYFHLLRNKHFHLC